MTNRWKGAIGFAAALLAGPTAHAHTSYLLPTTFATSEGSYVTLQASFTENFFTPEIAVRSDDYHLLQPDGSRADFVAVTEFRQMVVLESPLEEEGTYRFTTGVRLGRKSVRALVDGEWKTFLPEGEAGVMGLESQPPENATDITSSQTETVADVYVSKGAPTRMAVDQSIGRLAINPVTHPNEIYLDEGFEFDLTFDGEPLADHTMTLYRNGGDYEEPKYAVEVTTDDEGRLALSFDQPGVYLVMTRHRADAPDGADTDERSYTTSLTFEVLR